MPSNTTFDPQNANDFQKSKLRLNGLSVTGTAAHGESTNIDLLMTDDFLLTDGILFANNSTWGDKIDFQVVAPTGFSNVNVAGGYTFTEDTVLLQPLTDWIINPQKIDQSGTMANYPAKIYAGLILRVVYHSISNTTDVGVGINYKLHKVLV